MNFQKRKIGELANITTGLVVKRKQAESTDEIVKSYKMLTLKSFTQDGWLNTDAFEDFESSEELEAKYLTQEGDVVVRLSHPNTSVVISKAQTGLLISSLFAVVRLEADILLPGYLSIYLNSGQMKSHYARQAIGSTIQIIKTSMIKDIFVKFPDLNQQQKIVELHRLILREKELLANLVEEKNLYHKELINKCFMGGF